MVGAGKKLGVIGGQGPSATAHFLEEVIQISQREYGCVQDVDYPEIFLHSRALPEFDERGHYDPEKSLRFFRPQLTALEAWGADCVVMPCNTIHALTARLQKEASTELVDIVEVTVQAAVRKGWVRVGVVSSATTRLERSYLQVLADHGIAEVDVTDAEQSQLDAVILNVMGGRAGRADTDLLQTVIGRLAADGVEGVLLGCTEFPLVRLPDPAVPVVSSSEELAKAALAVLAR